MNELGILIRDGRAAFEPGEELLGTARWALDGEPRSVEIRLFWFTRGVGTTDTGVVETVSFEHPSATDSRPFRFLLPEAPYGFTGSLVTLVWALELIASPVESISRVEFIMAPDAKEVKLETLPQNRAKRWLFFKRPTG
jgi:hypothetical protein